MIVKGAFEMEKEIIEVSQDRSEGIIAVVLESNVVLKERKRLFYLHDEKYLTCFVHPRDPQQLFFDCGHLMRLKEYVMHHEIKQALLKQWLEDMMSVFEACRKELCLSTLEYIFIDEDTLYLQYVRLPIQTTSFQPENCFQKLALALFEQLSFDGDERWLSQIYLHLRSGSINFYQLRLLLETKKRSWRHWFFRPKKEAEDPFFQAFAMREINTTLSEEKTTMLSDSFKTQVLSSGTPYGYLSDEKQQILLIRVPFVLGRGQDCDAILDYPEVSKHHCQIDFEGGNCVISDCGSTNGTYLNGHKMTNNKEKIHENDVIQLAGHEFTYHE